MTETPMADAPERIWLQLGAGDEGTHTWADHQAGWDDDGEYEPGYIRADVAEAEKQLAVAAALREAADLAHGRLITETEGLGILVANRTKDAILSLDPDAIAAHDAAIREAEARGMERAAKELADLRGEVAFLTAQIEAWQSMAPPPEPDALRKQLERRAAIRAQEEGK